MKEIGYCGNPCDTCFYDQCPDCRTDNPFCSYATLFEDGVCPNDRCCKEKGHYGCWQCASLGGCTVGFFGGGDRDAMAYALFLQRHGEADFRRAFAALLAEGRSVEEIKAFETDALLAHLEALFAALPTEGGAPAATV